MLKQAFRGVGIVCALAMACGPVEEEVESVDTASEALTAVNIGQYKIQSSKTGKCLNKTAQLVDCSSAYVFDMNSNVNRDKNNFCLQGSTTQCLGRVFVAATSTGAAHFEVRVKTVSALQWGISRGTIKALVDNNAWTSGSGHVQLKAVDGSQSQQWSIF